MVQPVAAADAPDRGDPLLLQRRPRPAARELRRAPRAASAWASAAFGIANEKKWGYGLAVAAAVLQVAVHLPRLGIGGALTNFNPLLSLMFDGALVALLLHPMSRNYQRIWFRK